MRARIRRRALGLAVVASVAAGVLAPWSAEVVPSALAGTTTKQTYKLAPGVILTRIRYSTGPQEIRLLTINPSLGPRIDIATAGSAYPMWKVTSAMSKSIGGIAGVNGDFATPFGAQSHLTMIDGEIWTTGFTGGDAFAMTNNGKRAFSGNPKLVAGLRAVTTAQPVKPFEITTWNGGNPQGNAVGVFTPRGGSSSPPPGTTSPVKGDPYWCEARLMPMKRFGPTWSADTKTAITRRYRVAVQPEPCRRTPTSLGTNPDAVVIASRAKWAGGQKIKLLKRGDVVKLSWGFQNWPGVVDVIGGNPLLVEAGNNVAPAYTSSSEYILWNNPRTAVGFTSGCKDLRTRTVCKVLIMTVDGRQTSTGWSKGWQMPALAAELIKHGAVFAINLDGGGSTTMWAKRRNSAYCQTLTPVGGCLVNRPSRSEGERETIEALVVLPGFDSGTPVSLR